MNEEILPIRSAASGVFSSAPGSISPVTGPLEVMVAALVGGLLGLVAGLLVGTFAKLLTMDREKGLIGGMHWGGYGAALGGLVLAAVEVLD